MGGSLALDFSDLSSSDWPLIEYLYADENYKAKYNAYIQEVISGAFSANTVEATYSSYAVLVEQYAVAEIAGYTFLNNSSEFQQAINELKSHATQRAAAVNSYLK
jgi:hypothetical protein